MNMKRILLTALLSLIAFTCISQTTTDNFVYTGSPENFVVPPCVFTLDIVSAGAEGGGAGGDGATITTTVDVNPGDIISLTIGGEGGCPNPGYNGGGLGYASTNGNNNFNSCGGGGSTDIYINGVLYSIASGGGGSGGGSNIVAGGDGGCANGVNGTSTFGAGGTGGNQITGGTGGAPWAGTPPGGQNGSAGQGGNGGLWQTASGGGGGGGYFGGGGGGNDGCCTGANGGGAGGGGSSFIPLLANCNGGSNTGDGYVSITYTLVPLDTTLNVSTCVYSIYTFANGDALTITTDTTHISTILSIGGCDSIITTNVTLYPEYNLFEDITLCEGGIWTSHDGANYQNIASSFVHVSSLLTIDGCDSTITTNVIVNPTYDISEYDTICDLEPYTFHDGVTLFDISSDYNYTSYFNTINGCDSNHTVYITVIPHSFSIQDTTICSGDDYIFPDGFVKPNVTGFTTYNSVLISVNGCDSTITTNVNVFVDPIPDLNIWNIEGCSPLTTEFSTSIPGTNYIWDVTDGNSTTTFFGNFNIGEFYEEGSYDIYLGMISDDGCILQQEFLNAFEVHPYPVSLFGWNPNVGTVIDNQITFNNSSYDGDYYEWSFGDGSYSNEINPTHIYQDSGSYITTLITYNSFGCSDTSYGLIIINDVFYVYVPNVFTPDGFGANNIFLPQVTNVEGYHLTIFNRWGETMFESFNENVGWDGTYGSQGIVADGVYIWTITFNEIGTGRKFEHRGHLTVLK